MPPTIDAAPRMANISQSVKTSKHSCERPLRIQTNGGQDLFPPLLWWSECSRRALSHALPHVSLNIYHGSRVHRDHTERNM